MLPLETDLSRATATKLASKWLLIFLAVYSLAWVFAYTFFAACNPIDQVEMISWGQQWELGYHKHPPMPAWIAELGYQLTGPTVWMPTLLCQLCFVLTFWAVWRFSREFLDPWLAFLATLSLAACHYMHITEHYLNHNAAHRFCWVLAPLFFYLAVRDNKLRYWVLLGFFIAFGMWTKYDFALMVLTLLGFGLFNRQARARCKGPGPWLTLVVSLLLYAPHLWWMRETDFMSLSTIRGMGESAATSNTSSVFSHLGSPLHFLGMQLLAFLPVLLVLTPVIGRWKNIRPSNAVLTCEDAAISCKTPQEQRFDRAFLATTFFSPLLLCVLIGLITGAKFRDAWGASMWSLSGVVVLYFSRAAIRRKVPAPLPPKGMRASIILTCTLVFAVFLGTLTVDFVYPLFKGAGRSRIQYPGPQLALKADELWHQSVGERRLPAVGCDYPGGLTNYFLTGCVSIYNPEDRPDIYMYLDSKASPWMNDVKFQKYGGVLVAEVAKKPQLSEEEAEQIITTHYTRWQKRFPRILRPHLFSLDWQTSFPVEQKIFFLVAVVPPE